MMPEFEKTQWIRALDVWALGPLMIYVASRRRVPAWAKATLGIGGGLTILYNAHNYIANSRIREVTHARAQKHSLPR